MSNEYMHPAPDEVVVRESVEVPQPEETVVREEVVRAEPAQQSDRLVQPHVVGTPTADPNPGAEEANVVEERRYL